MKVLRKLSPVTVTSSRRASKRCWRDPLMALAARLWPGGKPAERIRAASLLTGLVRQKGFVVLVAEGAGAGCAGNARVPIQRRAGADGCGRNVRAGVTRGELLEGLAPGLGRAIRPQQPGQLAAIVRAGMI